MNSLLQQLETVVKIEMGLKFSISSPFPFLNKGITCAAFQATLLCCREALIIAVRGFVIIAPLSLRRRGGTSSRPTAFWS